MSDAHGMGDHDLESAGRNTRRRQRHRERRRLGRGRRLDLRGAATVARRGRRRQPGGDVGVAVPVVPRVVGERRVRSGLDQPEPRRRPAPTVDLGLGAGFLVAEAEAAQGGGGGGAGRRRRRPGRRRRRRGEGGGDRGSSGATGDRAMRSNYFPSVGRVLHLPVAQVITVRHGYAATRGAHVCAAPRLSAHRPAGQGPS